jgi:hypothetical protein
MSGAGTDQSSAEISDEMLAEMVRHLRSSWTPVNIDHIVEGVNSTVAIDVDTPMEEQRIVLKAITSTHPLAEDRARAEPQVLSLLRRETTVPVPTVFSTCAGHETYPTPYFLMEHVDGETVSAADAPNFRPDVRETIFREAGQNLAELHTLGPLDEVGDLVGGDGEISVLDTPESPSCNVFHDWLLESYDETLDQLLDEGGYSRNSRRIRTASTTSFLISEDIYRRRFRTFLQHNHRHTATRTTDTGIWLSPRRPERRVQSSTGRISCPLHRDSTLPSRNRSY